MPATDPALVDAWFRLGFGQQQAHGVRELDAAERIDDFEIREPTEEDIDQLMESEVDLALARHQGASPVFSGISLPTPDVIREEWHKTLADDEERVLIGFLEAGQSHASPSRTPRSRGTTTG